MNRIEEEKTQNTWWKIHDEGETKVFDELVCEERGFSRAAKIENDDKESARLLL
jgi:hypothetical protein